MSPKEIARYASGIDIWQQQLARERELHADGVGDPHALPVESGWSTGYEIYKQRVITIARISGRTAILATAGDVIVEAAVFVVQHL